MQRASGAVKRPGRGFGATTPLPAAALGSSSVQPRPRQHWALVAIMALLLMLAVFTVGTPPISSGHPADGASPDATRTDPPAVTSPPAANAEVMPHSHPASLHVQISTSASTTPSTTPTTTTTKLDTPTAFTDSLPGAPTVMDTGSAKAEPSASTFTRLAGEKTTLPATLLKDDDAKTSSVPAFARMTSTLTRGQAPTSALFSFSTWAGCAESAAPPTADAPLDPAFTSVARELLPAGSADCVTRARQSFKHTTIAAAASTGPLNATAHDALPSAVLAAATVELDFNRCGLSTCEAVAAALVLATVDDHEAAADTDIATAMGRLRKLDLGANGLADAPLPSRLFDWMTGLEVLFLTGNGLTHVPAVVRALPRLTRLSLKSNALQTLNAAVELPAAQLVHLILTENRLRTVSGFGALTQVRKLMLAGNSLTDARELFAPHCAPLTSAAGATQPRNATLPAFGTRQCTTMVSLQLLRLARNGLRTVEGLGPLVAAGSPRLAWAAIADNPVVRAAVAPSALLPVSDTPLASGDKTTSGKKIRTLEMRVAGCDVAHPLGRGASGLVTRCVLLPAASSPLGTSNYSSGIHSYAHGTDTQPIAAKFFHPVSSDGGAQGEADALTALAVAPPADTAFDAAPFFASPSAAPDHFNGSPAPPPQRLYRFVELVNGSRREVAHGRVDLRRDIRTVRFESAEDWAAVRVRLEVPLVNGTGIRITQHSNSGGLAADAEKAPPSHDVLMAPIGVVNFTRLIQRAAPTEGALPEGLSQPTRVAAARRRLARMCGLSTGADASSSTAMLSNASATGTCLPAAVAALFPLVPSPRLLGLPPTIETVTDDIFDFAGPNVRAVTPFIHHPLRAVVEVGKGPASHAAELSTDAAAPVAATVRPRDENGNITVFNIAVTEARRPSGCLLWRERWQLSLDVARGLAAMHRRGVVHGDVYAHNVMVVSRPGAYGGDMVRAILSDFGASFPVPCARDPESGAPSSPTNTSCIGGVFGRADIRALGVFVRDLLLERNFPACEGALTSRQGNPAKRRGALYSARDPNATQPTCACQKRARALVSHSALDTAIDMFEDSNGANVSEVLDGFAPFLFVPFQSGASHPRGDGSVALTPVSLMRALIEQDEHAHRANLLRVWMSLFRGDFFHVVDVIDALLAPTQSPSQS